MKPLTRAQREAVKRLFDRCPVYPGGYSASNVAYRAGWRFVELEKDQWRWVKPDNPVQYEEAEEIVRNYKLAQPLTYIQFRRLAHQSHMDCVLVSWLGMTMGIETDGYTHS